VALATNAWPEAVLPAAPLVSRRRPCQAPSLPRPCSGRASSLHRPQIYPADFSFFFDTGGRRRCYLAPEDVPLLLLLLVARRGSSWLLVAPRGSLGCGARARDGAQ